jgi:hypothetical protein
MAGTKRTPLLRESGPVVTGRVLEIFDQMERCQRARRGVAGCRVEDQTGSCLEECRPCQQWRDLSDALHKELALEPWAWPPVSHNPYPPGTVQARAWSREIARSDWDADRRYVLLKAALLAARRAADESAAEVAT